MHNRFGLMPSFAEYVKGHQTLTVPANYEPTKDQHQAILASIIGDGYLAYPYKNDNPMARIVWNMGDRKHAEHKLKFFKFLGARMTVKPNGGWGETMHSVVTKSHPLLTRYMEEYRDENGNKKVERIVNELDWFGWAWLYGDDGHLAYHKNSNGSSWASAYIHSEGYGKEGTQMYIDALARLLGSDDGINMQVYTGGQPTKTRYCVRMNNEQSKKFIAGIAPYMANGMEYKIHGR